MLFKKLFKHKKKKPLEPIYGWTDKDGNFIQAGYLRVEWSKKPGKK